MTKQKTEKINKKRIVLLDAHAIIHRAYHALPEFVSSKGEPTGALYGISTMLMKIIKDLKPDQIIACYDLPQPTFRHEAFDGYKAQRSKAEGDLVSQIKRSRDIFKAFNIPMYDKPGFEADDILGTIVEKLSKQKDAEIVIASGDMDTLQLVKGKKVQVYTLKKGINDTILYDENAVKERFGFGPELLPDYKGLRGDPSDNIPGVQGIGEKTATELIQKFGTIESLYKKLKKDRKVFLEAGIKERMVKLLEENEEEAMFSKTLAEIRRDAPIDFELPDKEWKDSVDPNMVEKIYSELEFKNLNERFKELLHSGSGEKKEEPEAKEIVPEEEIEKTGIALWLLHSDTTNPDLEDILSFSGKKKFNDAKEEIFKELKQKKLDDVYENIEMPIYPIIKKAENRGILVDKKYLSDLSTEYHKELDKIEKKIWQHAGEEFNINSPKQLGEILFDKMNLTAKGLKKTEGGARSTRVSELEKLKDIHPIINEIMSHRELQKLLTTYIDNIPPMLDENNRLHTHFVQAGSTTGRFASINPNLQNIPIKSELGRNIRKGFISAPGYELLSLDYSQIELRIAALLSEDKELIEIFKQKKDVHSSVASRVFGVKESDVTSEMRRQAKVINFGIIYGMGINALKENLGGTRAEAEQFYNSYFEQFPGVVSYLNEVKQFATKNGYTETLFGRRRYFPAMKSSIQYVRAMAERMAINAPIQGTAADLIKMAIKSAEDSLKKNNLLDKTHLLLQVHDELIYEVEKSVVNKAEEVIKEAMENVLNVSNRNKNEVPIEVHAKAGKSWGEMEEA